MKHQNSAITPYAPRRPDHWPGGDPGNVKKGLDQLGNVGIIKVSDTDPGEHLTGLAWLDTSVPSSVVTRIINLITSDTTIDATYDAIEVDASNGPVTITLPAAATLASQFDVKKIDSTTNTVTVAAASGETIDDAPTAVLTVQYESITVYSNLSEWWIS